MKDDAVYLRHIADAAQRVREYTADGRDILIHHYFGVKLETVWQVVEGDLAPLEQRVASLLESNPEAERLH